MSEYDYRCVVLSAHESLNLLCEVKPANYKEELGLDLGVGAAAAGATGGLGWLAMTRESWWAPLLVGTGALATGALSYYCLRNGLEKLIYPRSAPEPDGNVYSALSGYTQRPTRGDKQPWSLVHPVEAAAELDGLEGKLVALNGVQPQVIHTWYERVPSRDVDIPDDHLYGITVTGVRDGEVTIDGSLRAPTAHEYFSAVQQELAEKEGSLFVVGRVAAGPVIIADYLGDAFRAGESPRLHACGTVHLVPRVAGPLMRA